MRLWRVKAYLVLAVMAFVMAIQARGAELMSKVKVGDPAPDFMLFDQNGQQVKLSDFRGKKNIVLAFYVKAFTAD